MLKAGKYVRRVPQQVLGKWPWVQQKIRAISDLASFVCLNLSGKKESDQREILGGALLHHHHSLSVFIGQDF
jgi:hypothetical protein